MILSVILNFERLTKVHGLSPLPRIFVGRKDLVMAGCHWLPDHPESE